MIHCKSRSETYPAKPKLKLQMTPCYYWFPSIQIYSNRKIINKYTKYVQNICSLQCVCLLQVKFRHKVKSQFGKFGDDCSTASRFKSERATSLLRSQIQEKRQTSKTARMLFLQHLMWSGAQRWPMGFAGSVRLG